MWIECRNGTLINIDNFECIYYSIKHCAITAEYHRVEFVISEQVTEEVGKTILKKIKYAIKQGKKTFSIPTLDELNAEPKTETVSKKEPCMSFTEAINLWNTLADKGYKQVSKRGKDTQQGKMLEARLLQYTKEEWERAIENVRRSDYLPKATWFDFDWFIRPSNFPKVLDGNYNTAEDRIDTNEKAWWDE